MKALRRGALVASVIASLLAGCASTDSRLLPPPSEQMRSHMMSVTVVAANSDPEMIFHGPAKGALEGAWRGARFGFVVPLVATSATPYGAALGVALAPIGALLGASIGAGAAESSAKVQERESVIRQTLLESQGRERARECVEAAVREQASHVSLAPSSAERPDTILEITVERLGLSGDTWFINPDVQFVMSQRARIVRASDGAELHAQAITWRGQFRPLEQWAAEDGAPVKEAVRRACRDIAEALIDELFLVYQPTGKR